MSAARTEDQLTPAVVPGPPGRLLLHDGAAIEVRPGLEELTALLSEAGLTGRGGAGFPAGRKLATVAAQARRPAVVVNAMEGEPLARKDETLLALAPGLVFDGAAILARALRARRSVLAVGAQIPLGAVRMAAAERPGSAEVRALPDTFVGGQESALVAALNGRAPIPTDPATPIWQRGLDRRPTLVVNAETAAQVALLARHGAEWFRREGTADDPGTFLLSISGSSTAVIGTGVTEAGRGTPVDEVLERFAVRPDLVGGVLVGGYHGAWLPPSAVRTRLDRASLSSWGASPGAGVVYVLDRRHCPLALTARIADYLAGQSARQCGPCVNGLPRLAATLGELARPATARRPAGLAAEVARLAGLVDGRGACAHPDGTARLVRSTLRTFAGHVEAHLDGSCPR
jgi:NADH:ubiquinone oxidoreductase subunit F (NADH-binding)